MGKQQNIINITNKRQEVSPFPLGDHKTAMNRRQSLKNTQKNQMIHKRSTALERSVKNILLEGLNPFQAANLTFRCGARHIDVWFA